MTDQEQQPAAPPELELSIPGIQPDIIVLNGKRYICLSTELTPDDEDAIKKAIRRYDRMAAVSQVTQHDGLACAMLGDNPAAQFYLDWHK